jgi:exopolysaccharide biosynthesis polyprenyl glycosylphosphotransferase
MSFSLLGRSDLPASFFICLWALVTPVEIGTRLLVRTLLFSLRRHGRNLRALLIVGADERATQFASRIEQRPELGYVVLGLAAVRSDHAMQSSERVVCRLESLARFLRDNVVDEVVVCLTLPVFYDEVLTVARICREQGIMMRIHGDLLDSALRVTRIDQFAGDRLFTVTSDTAPLWAAAAKYFVDWVGSAALICIFSPVFLVAALAVKISSPGPILFTQLRLGRNKRPFKLYKFRTMEVNAEQKLAGLEKLNEAQGPVFKMRNDPRVTGIGRVLRKLSVDELPQLVNVFKGDMSLVGPRPLPIRDYSGFSEDWHLRRFSVRPGISCLWQISGRSEIGFDEWMELDMQYIDQWSFWLDVKILAKTIPAVVRGAGAY